MPVNFKRFLVSAAFLPLIFLCVSASNAQTNAKKDLPLWQSYKGVTIGMPATEARAKLGAPKSENGDDWSYVFSDTETAEVMLDAQKKVRAVTVMFSEDHQNPPKFEEIFGKGVTVQPKPDGMIYKLIRYADAGYWVSYSRLAGEKAMVIVMIQKL
jgi:hypothetical protein